MADNTTNTTSTTTPADSTAGTTTPSATTATTVESADAIAQQDFGYDNALDFLTALKNALDSGNVANQKLAEEQAADFTAKLIYLVLYQRIESHYNLEPYNWLNKFESQKIDAGNSHQYLATILTGNASYVDAMFVPNELTLPKIDSSMISLYDVKAADGKTLSQYGFQYKKPLTIQKVRWLEYFKAGTLQEFIEKITQEINTSFELFKVQLIQKMITDAKALAGQSASDGIHTQFKKIAGTATNMLTCFTNEIYPNIVKMRLLNSDYNLNLNGVTDTIFNSSKDDLLILVSTNTYTKLNSGILANVYNNKLASISSYINDENLILTGGNIVVGDQNTAISVSNTPLIGDDEVIVLDKNAIKQLYWVESTERQSWAHNMTLEIVLHVWGAFGWIPWGKGFYYQNANLATLPQ